MHHNMGPGARQGQRDDATHAPSRAGYYGDLVLKWTIVHHACIDITPQRNVKPVCYHYNPQIPQMTQINTSLDSSASSAQSADLFLTVHRMGSTVLILNGTIIVRTGMMAPLTKNLYLA
jgi:hypothetical protein